MVGGGCLAFNHEHHLVDGKHGRGYGQDKLQRDPETCKAESERCIGEELGHGITGEGWSRLRVHPTQQSKQTPEGEHWNREGGVCQTLIGISPGQSCKDV